MEIDFEHRPHYCKDGEESTKQTWPVDDAQGIFLCNVCEDCEAQKLSKYRPEILNGYSQDDVDEQIEPDY